MINFIKPNEAAVRVIAADMRHADAVEVMASHGYTPIDALMSGWDQSHFATIVTADGIPVAMFGLTSVNRLSGIGVPWLLSSEVAMQYKREFLLQSPPVVEQMLNICPKLYNYVHAENKVSIRWLKWLGFTIDEPGPFGVDGAMFHRFHLEKDNV